MEPCHTQTDLVGCWKTCESKRRRERRKRKRYGERQKEPEVFREIKKAQRQERFQRQLMWAVQHKYNRHGVTVIKNRSHCVITQHIPETQMGTSSTPNAESIIVNPLWCLNSVSTSSKNTWKNPQNGHQLVPWGFTQCLPDCTLKRFKSCLCLMAFPTHPHESALLTLNKLLLLMPTRQNSLPVCRRSFSWKISTQGA